MGGKSRAFLRGGFWLLFALFLLGTLAEAIWNDRGPAVVGRLLIVFAVGGTLGVIVYALRSVARSPGIAASGPWSCDSCGASNAGVSRGCVACGELRR